MANHEGEIPSVLAPEKKVVKKKVQVKKKGNLNPIILGSILPIVLILSWEVLSRLGVVPSYQLPAPTMILAEIKSMAQNGTLWGHIGVTTYRVFLGSLLGTFTAVVLGSLVGFYKNAENLLDPMIQAFRS